MTYEELLAYKALCRIYGLSPSIEGLARYRQRIKPCLRALMAGRFNQE